MLDYYLFNAYYFIKRIILYTFNKYYPMHIST